MTISTSSLLRIDTAAAAEVAALRRALTLAEERGDCERVAMLYAIWFELERRDMDSAVPNRPGQIERRRRTPPRLVVDDDMAEAWLSGRPIPPR